MGQAPKRRKTAGKRRANLSHKFALAPEFGGNKDLVVKFADRFTGKKDVKIVIDDAMFQRTLQQSPVAGTRSRSVYREAAKKVLAGRNIKVVRSA
jgi:hypothetical protein